MYMFNLNDRVQGNVQNVLISYILKKTEMFSVPISTTASWDSLWRVFFSPDIYSK